MREILSSLVIDAPAARVYELLADFGGYEVWNPFIIHAEGEARPGERVRIRIRPPGWRESVHVVTILTVEPNREITWLGRMWLPGVLDGHHIFRVEPATAKRCRLVHNEAFRGILVPFVWSNFIDTRMRDGFAALNHSLKAVAES
jgi:hypothetical protein